MAFIFLVLDSSSIVKGKNYIWKGRVKNTSIVRLENPLPLMIETFIFCDPLLTWFSSVDILSKGFHKKRRKTNIAKFRKSTPQKIIFFVTLPWPDCSVDDVSKGFHQKDLKENFFSKKLKWNISFGLPFGQ